MSYSVAGSTDMHQVPRKERSGREEYDPLITSNGTLQGNRWITDNTYAASSQKSKGTGDVATFFNFIKASIGSGSFALAWGIMKAGVLVGCGGMILLGIASVYTMQLMLEVKDFIVKKVPPEKRKELNYTEVGRQSLGTLGAWVVNVAVVGCNLGVCAGYMIFISTNLEWVSNCAAVRTSHNPICFSTWEIYAILLPILIILTYLPSFKILAYAAYIGSVFLVIAMAVVYAFGHGNVFCAVDNINGDLRYLPDGWTGIAQWFGVTAFLFCVHSMVIPLESVMKKPRDMPLILDSAALAVVGINLPFALYGYLLFGDQIQGYVFSNLPGNAFNTVVRAFLSVELIFTFPIVMKPATEVVEEIVKNALMFVSRKFAIYHIPALYKNKTWHYTLLRILMIFVLRALMVLVSWGVAVAIPRFELCLALVGSLTTTVLAFVLPPLFHMLLKWHYTALGRNLFHVALLVVGILVTVLATSINLYMAIKSSGGGTTCDEFKVICNVTYHDSMDHCYEVIAV